MNARGFLIACTFMATLGHATAENSYAQARKDARNNAAEGAEIVAVINGDQVITRKEIDELIGAQLYDLQERIYNLRKNALDNLLSRLAVEQEARIRGITVEELKRQLVPDRVEINQRRIDQVYTENVGSLGNMNEDEAKQRIRFDLENSEKISRYKAAIAELKSKAKVNTFLPEPAAPKIIVSDNGPSRGSKNAAVTIIEFSDFQCPYCRQGTNTLRQVMQSYGDNIRLVYKHMPLRTHPDAFKAAQASVCVDAQGKFWEYHDLLSSSSDLSADALRKYAVELGLKKDEFESCIDSEVSKTVVLKDVEEARKADVQGTPTFVINGIILRGAKGLDEFKKVIDQELKRDRGPSHKVISSGSSVRLFGNSATAPQ